TVVNLRGTCLQLPWYLEESRATERLNLSQQDVCLSAGRSPSVPEMRRLVEGLDRSEYPILLHCRRGADRTGLAATVVLLLQTGATLPEARRQLGPRYGHVAIGRPRYLDRFFDLYEAWLDNQSKAHTPTLFRSWLLHEYCPEGCRARLSLLEAPRAIRVGEPFNVRVRAANQSKTTWRLKAGTNAGIHAGFILWDPQDHWLAEGRAGLIEAEVPPGQSIDIVVPLPAMKQPGKHRLLVDMVDEQQSWFWQTGSEPLEEELEVRE